MVYDVTVPISNAMPVWPNDPPVQLTKKSHLSRDKTHTVSVTSIQMGSHTGTHMDAPSHMIEGGKHLDEFPLDTLIGKVTVVEIPSVRSIGRAQLEGFDGQLPHAGGLLIGNRRRHDQLHAAVAVLRLVVLPVGMGHHLARQ